MGSWGYTASGGDSALLPALRLSASSTEPILDGSSATLYCHRFNGYNVKLYSPGSSSWSVYTLPEVPLNIACPSLQYFRIYDALLRDSGGIGLELIAWDASAGQTTGSISGATNATPIVITSNAHGLTNGKVVGVRALGGNTEPNDKVWTVANVSTNTFELQGSAGSGTYTSGGNWYLLPVVRDAGSAITLQDGTYVNNANKGKLYVGTVLAHNGNFDDIPGKRGIWNIYNQIVRPLRAQMTGGNYSYVGTSYRAANNQYCRPWVICGVTGRAWCDIMAYHVGYGDNFATGIGVNNCTTNGAIVFGNVGGFGGSDTARIDHAPPIGLTYYQILEITSGTGLHLRPSPESGFNAQSGIHGYTWG